MHKLRWYFELAQTTALKSKDLSHKVGAIVVGPDGEIRALGYNGFVRGAPDAEETWTRRPDKYKHVIHAEANCVANAARCGTSLKGCEAYVTLPPCSSCTALLAQSGITMIRFLVPIHDVSDWHSRWADDFCFSLYNAAAAGITLGPYSGRWVEDHEQAVDLFAEEVQDWWSSDKWTKARMGQKMSSVKKK